MDLPYKSNMSIKIFNERIILKFYVAESLFYLLVILLSLKFYILHNNH